MPADEEVPQPSTEVVEETEIKQVVDGEATEQNQPEKGEVDIEQIVEENQESALEDQNVELHLEPEENGCQSHEEQPPQSQDQREESQNALVSLV